MDSAKLMNAAIRDNEKQNYTKSKCQPLSTELHRILCMQGGEDDGSYAKNSDAPASALALSKPLVIEAINSMDLFATSPSIRIADLGCAMGQNTLSTMDLIVGSLKLRYEKEANHVPQFEAFFSDLPSNDFNSLFRSLWPSPYFAAGVPGSFYKRLFPKASLHLAVSLSALHWLSQIPEAVLDKRSPAWNGGRAWIDGAKKEVVDEYSKQSEDDIDAFLRCRREELAQGGVLFILMAGRQGSERPDNQLGDPDSRAKHPFTGSMDQAWQDLLNEGLIDEDARDTFNIPAYMRSMEEVRKAFDRCEGFELRKLEFHRIMEHSREQQEQWIRDPVQYGRSKGNLVRATFKPIVQAHLGTELSDELFERFEKKVAQDTAMLHKTCFYGVIVASAVRK